MSALGVVTHDSLKINGGNQCPKPVASWVSALQCPKPPLLLLALLVLRRGRYTPMKAALARGGVVCGLPHPSNNCGHPSVPSQVFRLRGEGSSCGQRVREIWQSFVYLDQKCPLPLRYLAVPGVNQEGHTEPFLFGSLMPKLRKHTC